MLPISNQKYKLLLIEMPNDVLAEIYRDRFWFFMGEGDYK